jgi:DNA-binding beta-propeller fold protein YncE
MALALSLFSALAVSGCRADKCKSSAPAFQVDVSLPAGISGGLTKDLLVQIDAAGLHREQVLENAGLLDDGKTSFAVDVGAAGTKGFTAELTVTARDASGTALAVGRGSFSGWGNACNFFELALGGGSDGPRVDLPRGDRHPDGPRRDQPREISPPPPTMVSTIANSQLCSPHDVLFAGGILYGANMFGHRICTVSTAGKFTDLAGTGTAGYANGPLLAAQFNKPASVTSLSSSQLLVADSGNHCIRLLDLTSRTASTYAGTPAVAGAVNGPASQATFNNPRAAVAVNGAVYVVDTDNRLIRKVADGVVTTFAGNGSQATKDGPLLAASFNFPHSIAFDGATSTFYVTECGGHVVRKIAGGQVTVFAGGGQGFANGPLPLAQFSCPAGIVAHQGALVVADYLNNRIRLIRGGTVTTLAGSGAAGHVDGTAATAQFAGPAGLAYDAAANTLYVADFDMASVRAITGLVL